MWPELVVPQTIHPAFDKAAHYFGVKLVKVPVGPDFRADVPVTRELTEAEVAEGYERNTGLVIVERFAGGSPDAADVAAVLVANHGPFTWGQDAAEAVERMRVLEFLARMECTVRLVAPDEARPAPYLVDKHFLRKHGSDAYYGQR